MLKARRRHLLLLLQLTNEQGGGARVIIVIRLATPEAETGAALGLGLEDTAMPRLLMEPVALTTALTLALATMLPLAA